MGVPLRSFIAAHHSSRTSIVEVYFFPFPPFVKRQRENFPPRLYHRGMISIDPPPPRPAYMGPDATSDACLVKTSYSPCGTRRKLHCLLRHELWAGPDPGLPFFLFFFLFSFLSLARCQVYIARFYIPMRKDRFTSEQVRRQVHRGYHIPARTHSKGAH